MRWGHREETGQQGALEARDRVLLGPFYLSGWQGTTPRGRRVPLGLAATRVGVQLAWPEAPGQTAHMRDLPRPRSSVTEVSGTFHDSQGGRLCGLGAVHRVGVGGTEEGLSSPEKQEGTA